MRILYFSDLHLNPASFEPQVLQNRIETQIREEKPDLVLCAGDFCNVWHQEIIESFDRVSGEVPYVRVFGNHDFYQNSVHRAHDGQVRTLDLGDYLVVSATLWTNFFNESIVELRDYRMLNDVYYIQDWGSQAALETFKKQFAEVKRIVSENPYKKIILLTHHGLSKKSISERFKNETLNGSFVNDLDDWILMNQQIVLAVHGHVHQSFDYKIGNTRIVCHPRGYPREENYSKYEAKVVEA